VGVGKPALINIYMKLKKILLYISIFIIPLFIYPIMVNGIKIDMRSAREIAFYSFGILSLSYLLKNKWLRYFLIWCVISWWGNFFIPNNSYIGLTNILSAICIYLGISYLLKIGYLKVDTLLKIICITVLFQVAWMTMQVCHFDPVFHPINADGAMGVGNVPLVGWSGNPSILGIFIAINSFLLLHYFKIKGLPILFILLLIPIIMLKNSTTFICYASGILFYLMNTKFKGWKIRKPILLLYIIALSAIFFIFIKSPNFDRLPIWKQLFCNGIKLNPIFGKGINFFGQLQIYDKGGTPWDKAHNDYLQMILELGLIGFGLFTAFVVSKFREFFKSDKTKLQVCIMASIVAYLVSGISLFPMHLAQISFYAIILLACLDRTYDTDYISTYSK
jgi:O-antigen ligase